MLALLERLRLSLKRLAPLEGVALDLVGFLLRRLQHGPDSLLRLGEQLAGLLLHRPAMLRAVRVGGVADVARVLVCIVAQARGLARELLDPRRGTLLRLPHDLARLAASAFADLLRGRLGCLDDRAHLAADIGVVPRLLRLLGHCPGLLLWRSEERRVGKEWLCA